VTEGSPLVSPDGEEGGEEWVDEMGEGRQKEGGRGKRKYKGGGGEAGFTRVGGGGRE